MRPAVPQRPVGRALACLAVELDSLALEIERRDLTDLDVEFLVAAHRHLQIAAEALDAALVGAYAQIERDLDALGVAA